MPAKFEGLTGECNISNGLIEDELVEGRSGTVLFISFCDWHKWPCVRLAGLNSNDSKISL